MQQPWGRDPCTQRKCLSRDICACIYVYIERGLVSACPGRRIWLWLEFVSDSHVTAGSQQRFWRDGNSWDRTHDHSCDLHVPIITLYYNSWHYGLPVLQKRHYKLGRGSEEWWMRNGSHNIWKQRDKYNLFSCYRNKQTKISKASTQQ